MNRFLPSSKAQWLTYSTALVVATGLIVMVLMVEVSSQPQFCGSCHIMAPYFQSWNTSSHKNVACVECHISPGVTHEIRKKWEALSMVASYITGTYGTNPWAEIDDAACLRCHQRRLLAGTEVFGDILFDHGPHLAELRNGKKLRCTSCHSQIVQGEHIAVTTSTCILCHFKGTTGQTDTGRCTLCHKVPDRVIEKGLMKFDHGDVSRFNMNCQWCHSGRITGMEGRVPRERCFTCHNEQERLVLYDDHQLMHQTHVTDHKVDCMNCHLEIQHGQQLHQEAEVTQTNCNSCHEMRHSSQLSLYSGTGGKGVEPMPDSMFLAGVACQGCHIQLPGHEVNTSVATEVSCMSCHGPRYRSIFHLLKDTVEDRTAALRRQYRASLGAFGDNLPQTVSDGLFNLDLVEKGHGIHNVQYSLSLLTAAHQQLNEARQASGRSALPMPWPETPFESACFQCHQGIESYRANVFGRMFSHNVHTVRQRLQCETCHRPHEEREPEEVLIFGSEGCNSCHHSDKSKDCMECHSELMDKTVPSFRGEFDHALHVEMTDSCQDCHSGDQFRLDVESCSMCH